MTQVNNPMPLGVFFEEGLGLTSLTLATKVN